MVTHDEVSIVNQIVNTLNSLNLKLKPRFRLSLFVMHSDSLCSVPHSQLTLSHRPSSIMQRTRLTNYAPTFERDVVIGPRPVHTKLQTGDAREQGDRVHGSHNLAPHAVDSLTCTKFKGCPPRSRVEAQLPSCSRPRRPQRCWKSSPTAVLHIQRTFKFTINSVCKAPA